MVSITNISSAQASHYYRKDNYYLKADGLWQGKGAEALGLQGEVQKESFEKLIFGQDPEGNQLVSSGREHRAGIDLTFSAPKSVSICALVIDDDRILDAHDRAVSEALRYVEQHYAQARQTNNRVSKRVDTQNLVIAVFSHDVSRELDPQLHTHAVVMNMTQRPDGQWRALSNEEIFQNKMLIGQIYRNELARNLKELGYSVRSDHRGLFEIEGIDEKLIEHFSRRADQIQEKVQELQKLYPYIEDQKLREIATLGSRVAKKDVDMNTVREVWQERLELQGYTKEGIMHELMQKAEQARGRTMTEQEYIHAAARIQTEQESTFTREDILKTAMTLSVGEYRHQDLEKAFLEDREIVRLDRNIYTTREMMSIEKEIAEKVRQGHNCIHAIAEKENVQKGIKSFEAQKGITLTQGQKDAINHILTSRDAYIGIQGDAGTGKTTMLAAIREQAEKEGYEIRGLGFTGKAAAEVEMQAGIKSQTIDSFLLLLEKEKGPEDINARFDLYRENLDHIKDIEKRHDAIERLEDIRAEALDRYPDPDKKKQIWVVDEASMLGSRKMHELMLKAELENAKVVFIGDVKQLQSIEAGRTFQKLQETGELRTVRMAEIQRQRDESYRDIVSDMSEKRIGQALQKLEKQNRIFEIPDRHDRLNAITQDYMAHGKDTIVVTARNADRNDLNRMIRTELKQRNALSQKDHTFVVRESKNLSPVEKHFPQNYQLGDIVVSRRAGVLGRAGTEARVIHISDTITVTVRTRDGKDRVLDLKTQGQDLAVYQEKEQQFCQGDRVVFLKNDKGLNVKNGQIGEIKSIDEKGNARIQMEDGRVKDVNLKNQYNYIDHGYAVTSFKSQGQTSRSVIYHADTSRDLSFNQAYVAMTRGKEDLKIYTDSRESFKEKIHLEQTKTSTLDYSKTEVSLEPKTEKSFDRER